MFLIVFVLIFSLVTSSFTLFGIWPKMTLIWFLPTNVISSIISTHKFILKIYASRRKCYMKYYFYTNILPCIQNVIFTDSIPQWLYIDIRLNEIILILEEPWWIFCGHSYGFAFPSHYYLKSMLIVPSRSPQSKRFLWKTFT